MTETAWPVNSSRKSRWRRTGTWRTGEERVLGRNCRLGTATAPRLAWPYAAHSVIPDLYASDRAEPLPFAAVSNRSAGRSRLCCASGSPGTSSSTAAPTRSMRRASRRWAAPRLPAQPLARVRVRRPGDGRRGAGRAAHRRARRPVRAARRRRADDSHPRPHAGATASLVERLAVHRRRIYVDGRGVAVAGGGSSRADRRRVRREPERLRELEFDVRCRGARRPVRRSWSRPATAPSPCCCRIDALAATRPPEAEQLSGSVIMAASRASQPSRAVLLAGLARPRCRSPQRDDGARVAGAAPRAARSPATPAAADRALRPSRLGALDAAASAASRSPSSSRSPATTTSPRRRSSPRP